MTPTLPQTIILLALSRGERPPVIPPPARRRLLAHHWIAPPRPFAITDAGRDALARSPHLEQAQRALDRPLAPPMRRARFEQ